MKIVNHNSKKKRTFATIFVGDIFSDEDNDFYMKISPNGQCCGVDLNSGMIRSFNETELVTVHSAEVHILG